MFQTLAPWRVELLALAAAFLAAFLFLALLSLPDAACPDPEISICLLREGFGWGIYPLLLTMIAVGVHVSIRRWERPYHIEPAQVVGFELILMTLLPISAILSQTTLPQAHAGQGGGLVGWALSVPLIDFFGPLLTGLFYLTMMALGLALVFKLRWEDLLQQLNQLSNRLWHLSQDLAPTQTPPTRTETVSSPAAADAIAPPQVNMPQTPLVIHTAVAEEPVSLRRPKELPPLDLLEEGKMATLSTEAIEEKKQIIEETLSHFGLPAKVTQIQQGPAITQFGVEPGYLEKTGADGEVRQQKVRISQIAALRKDLALALAAKRLRIQAPVPGRGVVGIEVPNDEISIVRLRAILETETYHRIKGPLAVALGRDVSGAATAVDLAKMPHLLIAGTTGSGKSVCLNAMLTCLVMNNSPDDLHLIMIDPKKVEFIRFNGLPHLIGKVEVKADRAVGVLRWLTAEMDRRYEMFAQVNARNLGGYNRKVGRQPDRERLPYIAVFIDELADLMHTYPGDVERTLCRLAQMARATGIHLTVATQRPSTDVITGLIKANFPARISFAVASSTDSRVILDSVGAEHLLGSGDMLFLGPDASVPMRVQGVFVSDHEVEAIAAHWQRQMPPDFEPMAAPWESLIAKYALLEETDSLLEQAVELAQKRDTLSTSYLQRRLRIGYPRAARIMEHLYEMGLVEDPQEGGKTRRTTVSEEDDPLDEFISGKDDF